MSGSRPSSWLLFYQETHHENRQVFLQPLLPEDKSTNRVVGHQIHTVLSTACKNPGERIVPPDCPQQILSENSRFNSNWFQKNRVNHFSIQPKLARQDIKA